LAVGLLTQCGMRPLRPLAFVKRRGTPKSNPNDDEYNPFVLNQPYEGEWLRVQVLVQTKNGLLVRAEDGTFGLIKPVKLEELT
jgi:hypothetical protein